jgi:uncharacterized protein YceH (UPF0502 family)
LTAEDTVLPPILSADEARVIGCLLEKSVVTPDQYPLTLNALVSACNQKSSRNPVMSFEPGAVQRTIRDLESKHFVRSDENFKSRVEKYTHRFCNTPFSDYQFDPPQFAIVCLLLLRGPQTPGELRARSGRLHSFDDNAAVLGALNSLIEIEGTPILVKLPRSPGRKDAEYLHLFCGPIDVDAHASQVREAQSDRSPERSSVSDLTQRVNVLEAEVAELQAELQRVLESLR